jgi:hypothetical protein
MGQYFHYFAASADEAAAHVVDGPAGSGLPQVELKHVDPVVLLGHLVAAAAGEEFSLEDSLQAFLGSEPAPAGHLLVRVPDRQVAVLAAVADDQLMPLAVHWSKSEFWSGSDEDPDQLADAVHELRSVACSAAQPGCGMYAWALV